jgi:hypothetical protein
MLDSLFTVQMLHLQHDAVDASGHFSLGHFHRLAQLCESRCYRWLGLSGSTEEKDRFLRSIIRNRLMDYLKARAEESAAAGDEAVAAAPAAAAVVSRAGADYMDEGGGEARPVSGKLIVSQVRYTSYGVVSSSCLITACH